MLRGGVVVLSLVQRLEQREAAALEVRGLPQVLPAPTVLRGTSSQLPDLPVPRGVCTPHLDLFSQTGKFPLLPVPREVIPFSFSAALPWSRLVPGVAGAVALRKERLCG